jgi:negative regulator of replication initiation
MAIGLGGVRHIGRSVSDILHRLEKHGLSPMLSLEIQRGRDSDAEMAEDLVLAPGEELLRSLSAITHLIVYNESSDLTARELKTLARWIARFPALLHVSLRVRETAAAAAAH